MKMYYLLLTSLFVSLLTGCAGKGVFNKPIVPGGDVVLSAQKQLKTTFNNSFDVSSFKESAMPGLYEMVINGQMIYYHHEENILFLGQMFKQGLNLTNESLKQLAEKVDGSKGVLVGEEGAQARLIAILDPDCPYSQSYYRVIQQLSNSIEIEQRILFDISVHPKAKDKLAHVFCSANHEKAYHEIMGGTIDQNDYKNCSDYQGRYDRQLLEIEKLSVAGTPTVILSDQSIVSGFNQERLLEYFKAYRSTSTENKIEIDRSLAIRFGDKEGIEMTVVMDPDCPYCKKLYHYLQEKSSTLPIFQHVFLDARSKASSKKIAHVLCSENRVTAYHAVMQGTLSENQYQSCSAFKKRYAQQKGEINRLNIQGTPTVLINNRLIQGFDVRQLEKILILKNNKEG